MIKSFADKEAEKIFHQATSRKLPMVIQDRALVKLLFIDSATSEDDLKIPPANHFEHLKGKVKEYCSIRISDQWRIQFKYINGDCYDVSIMDYH